jgi:ribonuclease R
MKHIRLKNNKGNKLSVPELTAQILKLFQIHNSKKYTAKQVIEKLKIANNKDSVYHVLITLTKKELLTSLKNDYFQIANRTEVRAQVKKDTKIYTGRVDLTKSGAAYILVDGLDTDIYVPERLVGNALDKDQVKVEVIISNKRRLEGKIIEVVSRSLTHVLGTLKTFKHYAIVVPEAITRFPDVLIRDKQYGKAKDGDKVIAEILDWGSIKNPTISGKVTSILKDADSNEVAMQSILIESGFALDFPKEVISELDKIDGTITVKDIKDRRDFRDVLTFTIDPETAKDFDDGISYRVLDDGNIEIGVHIADVSHYIKENSALDKEAYMRSTSVYLVDRCLPMLPERLSNDLCSLNPNEDKRTFAAVFVFDKKHKIVSEWFGKTIIHSDRRYTYEEAQEILETGKGDYVEELKKINEIAYKLRKDKFKNGAINFESEEVVFKLDENNKPISVHVKERKDAHLLIEDFMLLANKAVAKYIAKKAIPEVPFVYRVHDLPDDGKLADFALFAKTMGFSMKIDSPKNIAASFNALAKEAEKNEAFKVLAPIAIRTMAKAEYSTKNIGHYGLAFDYYTHFTSPIRRYSDVLVHRILFDNLDEKIHRVDMDLLSQKCKHISRQEIKATEAERASIKYKQVEWMMQHEGEVFEARVSGIIDKGIFVEHIDSQAEGLIPFSNMKTKFLPSENKLSVMSKRTGHELKMGDKVEVKLLKADLGNRRLEFELLEEYL